MDWQLSAFASYGQSLECHEKQDTGVTTVKHSGAQGISYVSCGFILFIAIYNVRKVSLTNIMLESFHCCI